jgi:hypothetical protein
MPIIFNITTKKTKTVSSLGWLLHHLKEVRRVELYRYNNGQAYLTAYLDSGFRFETTFGSYIEALRWLHRPSLRGVELIIQEESGQVTRTFC